MKNRKETSTVTSNSRGMDFKRVSIKRRIPANPCIVRNGLNTRTTRIALKFPKSRAARTPRITTKKSSLFHPSERYAFSCPKKPHARIFKLISKQKSARKIGSANAMSSPRVVSSNPGAFESIARKTQFKPIKPMMTLSKCLWYTTRIAKFRSGLCTGKTYRDFSIKIDFILPIPPSRISDMATFRELLWPRSADAPLSDERRMS
mmetsp:Transcript_15559/g.51074  ORF Transcript_15559/g.51074 Transcript_15559/m.51074 type:complete len:205 (+) Transcript_15559:719-1333(+)